MSYYWDLPESTRDVYFTWHDEKYYLRNGKVFTLSGKEMSWYSFAIKLLYEKAYIGDHVRYYSDKDFKHEEEPATFFCGCTPWELLHGNPNCKIHGRNLNPF